MERFVIEGGIPLSGRIVVDGAKNAALPACVASLLTDEPVTLHRVPELRDVSTILYTLGALGKRVVRHGEHVAVASGGTLSCEANAYSVRQMRASFLVLAPLVARLGRAVVPLPGGCVIGKRPIDLHLLGLRALGATVEERVGAVIVTGERLIGARIVLPFPSVGATEQILMAAVLAEGETVIENGAVEPEVGDLVLLLRKMGAKIAVDGRTYRIVGRSALHGAMHTLISDRLVAGTFLLAGAITGGRVTVERVDSAHLASFLESLASAGVEVGVEGDDAMTVTASGRPRPVRVTTAPHPGFPTDLHPLLVSCLSLGTGESSVQETIFEERFAYVEALRRMGARIRRNGATLSIEGVEDLRGQEVEATDIRGGAALVLAGLAARGRTVVTHLAHIDRGYSRLDEKLRGLGAKIDRHEES
jgi:UDP-N-acetylglucosamine 1-carboxyvinyltransferase